MRRYASLAIGLLIALAAIPAAGAGALEIEAPGGLWYEQDGSIGARGVPGRPLVMTLDEYELSAQSLQYDQRKRTGRAVGGVRWRDRRPDGRREIVADAITFTLDTKTGQAEGHVGIRERVGGFTAEIARFNLGKGIYELTGGPARGTFGAETLTAARVSYDATRSRVDATDEVIWLHQGANLALTTTAASFTYDLAGERGSAQGGVVVSAGEQKISADALQYEGSTNALALTGSATVTRGDLRLSAASVTWLPDQGLVVAAGKASFSDPVFAGASDEIRYETTKGLISLIGEARLNRGRDLLSGAEIVCDLATRTVRVSGGGKVTISSEG